MKRRKRINQRADERATASNSVGGVIIHDVLTAATDARRPVVTLVSVHVRGPDRAILLPPAVRGIHVPNEGGTHPRKRCGMRKKTQYPDV